jgi:MFS transporter, ACS family, D-galactonate transporter
MTTGTSGSVAMSAGKQVSASEIGSPWSGKRFYIAALLFLNLFINFTDRINLSVAGPAIAKDFGWDARKMGLLFSSYQWTYCLFLLPWGWVIDRMGTRLVQRLVGDDLVDIGNSDGGLNHVRGMLATRLALGAGEAASFPTSGKVVRQYGRKSISALIAYLNFCGLHFERVVVEHCPGE